MERFVSCFFFTASRSTRGRMVMPWGGGQEGQTVSTWMWGGGEMSSPGHGVGAGWALRPPPSSAIPQPYDPMSALITSTPPRGSLLCHHPPPPPQLQVPPTCTKTVKKMTVMMAVRNMSLMLKCS